MRCPFCAGLDTRVVDSRSAQEGRAVRRRRECTGCGSRFTTYERSEGAMVRKRDGRIEAFSAAKVMAGMSKAVADRQVPAGAIEALVARIERQVTEEGVEVTSEEIGRLVLGGLRELDEVAYLRFVSVYKEFAAAGDFEREMAALEGGDG